MIMTAHIWSATTSDVTKLKNDSSRYNAKPVRSFSRLQWAKAGSFAVDKSLIVCNGQKLDRLQWTKARSFAVDKS